MTFGEAAGNAIGRCRYEVRRRELVPLARKVFKVLMTLPLPVGCRAGGDIGRSFGFAQDRFYRFSSERFTTLGIHSAPSPVLGPVADPRTLPPILGEPTFQR